HRAWFVAAALTVRDRVVHRWLTTERASRGKGSKRVYYLSLEFLMGRLFDEVLINLGRGEIVSAALGDLGVDLARLRASEPDAALGNGGLGRLAACFLESMATLRIPACGYGIRFDYRLFRQGIRDGWQQEYPEEWLSFGNPWEFARPELIYDVHFGGRVEQTVGPQGIARSVWRPDETIEAGAYDTPIGGWRRRPDGAGRVQSGRACGCAIGASTSGSDLEDSVPERRNSGRAGVAAATGIFFRLRVAAGSRAAAPVRRWGHPFPPRLRCGSAK